MPTLDLTMIFSKPTGSEDSAFILSAKTKTNQQVLCAEFADNTILEA
jgi:hypothetical protein